MLSTSQQPQLISRLLAAYQYCYLVLVETILVLSLPVKAIFLVHPIFILALRVEKVVEAVLLVQTVFILGLYSKAILLVQTVFILGRYLKAILLVQTVFILGRYLKAILPVQTISVLVLVETVFLVKTIIVLSLRQDVDTIVYLTLDLRRPDRSINGFCI